ncbi:hypothetical protein H2198_004268 [Neophaeococcomyces mojaviensis]|uniref:Uncharacterized protein n=1 Tax=Neophaeococcomyces mojaviensis TaxID=3383035 RepID=A0ACC3A922_9EURO|nr:hypothetical protein H2198_004268 [Knufia sp. JES_112]
MEVLSDDEFDHVRDFDLSDPESEDVVLDSDPSPSTHHHFFATFSDLQAHIKEVHPPTCQYCPTSFGTNKELTRHLELQHGVIDPNKQNAKQYPCIYPGCKQIFTKQGNLNVHVKTVHEKQKDFVCGVAEVPVPDEVDGQSEVFAHGCGRSFTSKASLIEHVRTAHFHLPNRRAQKREEQRVKRQMEAGSSDESEPKRRMSRKDKGTKKSSALDNLTGLNIVADSPAPTTNFIFSCSTPSDNTRQDFENFMDDESDDLNQLSGSMTIIGDHLYHQGQGYHLVSENGSAESTNFDDGQYIPCDPTVSAEQTELFFPFEPEREEYHPAIDPALLSA